MPRDQFIAAFFVWLLVTIIIFFAVRWIVRRVAWLQAQPRRHAPELRIAA